MTNTIGIMGVFTATPLEHTSVFGNVCVAQIFSPSVITIFVLVLSLFLAFYCMLYSTDVCNASMFSFDIFSFFCLLNCSLFILIKVPVSLTHCTLFQMFSFINKSLIDVRLEYLVKIVV